MVNLPQKVCNHGRNNTKYVEICNDGFNTVSFLKASKTEFLSPHPLLNVSSRDFFTLRPK